MEETTIVGVYVAERDYGQIANNTTALCLEHQDTRIPGQPFKASLNAIQAYYTWAHCAVCGKYLGLPEDQTTKKRPAQVGQPERVVVLSGQEMRALVTLLMQQARKAAETGEVVHFASLLPDLAERQEIARAYYAWSGQPGGFYRDRGREYTYWEEHALLTYFAARLASDIAREVSQQAQETSQ